MGLRGSYLTVDGLIDKEGKSSKEIKAEKDKLVRGFKRILEGLGFTIQMISWYRNGNRDGLSGGRTEYYIFAGGDAKAVNDKLSNLSTLFDAVYQEPSYNNMCEIITILQELLPLTKNENLIDNFPDEQVKEIKKLFSLVDEIKSLKIFGQCEGNSKIKSELSRIMHNLEKIDKSKPILLKEVQELSFMEEFADYNNRKKAIEKTVVDFFLGKMNNMYFSGQKFFGKSSSEEFYQKIKRWHIKWLCLFDNINKLRQAEEFYNIYKFFDLYGEDENSIKDYFRGKKSLSDTGKKIYRSIWKLSIESFSEYYGINYDDDKLREMISDSSIKALLREKRNLKNIEENLSCCNRFVENVGQWRCREIDEGDMICMKVEAMRELGEITKAAQSDGMDSGERGVDKNVTENVEAYREKFVDSYYKLHIDKTIRKEFLECVFDLEHEQEGLITHYIPYAKMDEGFWDKPIVN